MNKLFYFVFPLLLLSTFSLSAQHLPSSLGLRVGSGAGISYKHMASDRAAIEGILMYRRGGLRLVGLLEAEVEVGRSNTFFFIGGGGHVGINRLQHPEINPYKVVGLDGIIGLEYIFPRNGMILSVDLKPMVEILQGWKFSGNSGGISLRLPIE